MLIFQLYLLFIIINHINTQISYDNTIKTVNLIDYIAISISIRLITSNNIEINQIIGLKYSDLLDWENKVNDFVQSQGYDNQALVSIKQSIKLKLDERGYSNNNNLIDSFSISSYDNPLTSIKSLLLSSLKSTSGQYNNNNYFFISNNHISNYNILLDIKYLNSNNFNTSVNSYNNNNIIIYQNRNAKSGGTLALYVLANQLIDLNYNVILCNDTNFNFYACTNPPVTSLVITGEWCEGALLDYNINKFYGRAVQYHLGFHHMSDICSGHVTIASSSYLSITLADRILGAYYLGCPLSNSMKHTITSIINKLDSNMYNQHSIVKENLIVFDYDYISDYPPEINLQLYVNNKYKVIFAKDIPHEELILILLRAKVVVDLALPGPERLATEGILCGAIPIISNRWGGSSDIDYPGVFKVDPFNSTEIIETISYIIDNYSIEIQEENQSQFFTYALSLWRSLNDTANVVIGSNRLHFILTAKSLKEEYEMNLQILCILFIYPLASIDIYVMDVNWYVRHHYQYYTMLKASGYIRNDIFDPNDENTGISYINIKSFNNLSKDKESLYPNWCTIIILLYNRNVLTDPIIHNLTDNYILLDNYQIVGYIIQLRMVNDINLFSIINQQYIDITNQLNVKSSVVNVCDLFRIYQSHEHECDNVNAIYSLYGILDTIPWIKTMKFIYSFSLNDKIICN